MAVLIFSLGAGASTALLALLYAVAIEPLPVRRPRELVYVYSQFKMGLVPVVLGPHYDQIHARASDLASFTAHWRIHTSPDFQGGGELRGEAVAPNYFDVLGIEPQIGLSLDQMSAEDVGSDGPVVISDGLWTRYWRRDDDVLGSHLRMGGKLYTVIGVMPPRFRGVSDRWSPSQFWILFETWRADYRSTGIGVIARLHSGATVPQLQAVITDVARGAGDTLRYIALKESRGALPFDPMARVVPRKLALGLGVLASLILAVVSVNVGFLLRAVALSRTSEFAIKTALGATFRHIAAGLLSEICVIVLLGSILGYLWAWILLEVFQSYSPERFDVSLTLDMTFLAIVGGQGAVVGVSIALVPLRWLGRTDLTRALFGSHSVGPVGTRWLGGAWGGAAAGAQLVLTAAVLVVAAGGVLGVARTENRSPGYNWTDPVVVGVHLRSATKIDDAAKREAYAKRSRRFYRELLDRLNHASAIEGAAVADTLPLQGALAPSMAIPVGTHSASGAEVQVVISRVSPGYFDVLEVPLVRGRSFETSDTQVSHKVALISESLERRFWPTGQALGHALRIQGVDAEYVIVGVVRDTLPLLQSHSGASIVYLSLGQEWMPLVRYAIVRGADASPVAPAVWDAIDNSDNAAAILRTAAMRSLGMEILYPRRIAVGLLIAAGMFVLFVAGVGLYAQLSFAIERRRREMGIRLAVGASSTDILRLVVNGVGRLAVVSLLLGTLLGAVAVHAISSTIVAIPPPSALSIAVVIGFQTVVVACSSIGPALRAARVDARVIAT